MCVVKSPYDAINIPASRLVNAAYSPDKIGKVIEYNERYYPENCDPKSLRGHIGNQHLTVRTIADIGIPRFDLEICQYRKLDMNWVLDRVYANLERTDSDIQGEIDKEVCMERDGLRSKGAAPSISRVTDLSDFTVRDYRTMLVKTLIYMEELGLADVDWNRVERSFPGCRDISLDLEFDTTDTSYYQALILRK